MLSLVPGITKLTPEQFKALAKYKGWKYTMLAERWEITPVWVSNIARDPNRSVRYDDMLIGLPNLNKLSRERARRKRLIDAAMANVRPSETTARRAPPQPGYRYQGYLTTGAIVTASTDVGSMAEEGMRGVVFEVINRGNEEIYGVIFESGMWDWFSPDYVDLYLAGTGLLASEAQTYRYLDEEKLQEDFAAGMFECWPSA